MPHATDSNMASVTNGDSSNSKFISKVTSYPIVHDTIDGFQSNPYGKKSIELVDGAYQKFGKPVEPYFETPYNYAKPYVAKADELASSGLDKVDAHFPIVKEDTQTVLDTGKSYILWPFAVANNGKDYVLKTWNDEYTKTANHKERGQGLQTSVLALVSTQLKISSDFFQAIADILGPKYEESKKQGAHLAKQTQDAAEKYSKVGQEKVNELKQTTQEKGEQAKQEAVKTKDEAQKKASK
nr:hypothetical protein CFP56_19414 [Quercus suber]